MKYWAILISIPVWIIFQAVNLVAAAIGVPICAALAYGHGARFDPVSKLWHWPAWAWLWDNDEDGVFPNWYVEARPNWSMSHTELVWTAFRNSVHNFGYLSWVRTTVSPTRRIWVGVNSTWVFGMQGIKTGGFWISANKKWYARGGWAIDKAPGTPVSMSLSCGRNRY